MEKFNVLNIIYNSLKGGATKGNKYTILQDMADQGLGPYYGVKLLRQELNYPLNEAKRIVHESNVWEFLSKNIEELHDAAEATLDEF